MALTPLNTDANQFPLSGSPHLSRVSTHFRDGKNYTMLAFNPGFALQAAELNEIQELFFLNQSLTQRMNANWILMNNSNQVNPYSAPFWEGLIPLSPSYLTISNLTSTAIYASFTYTLNPGWYFYTDPTSKLSFWTYSDNTFQGVITTTEPLSYHGTFARVQKIDCCQTNDSCIDQDSTLRDGSQQTYQEFTCGASRIKAIINEAGSTKLNSYVNLSVSGFAQIFILDLQSSTRSIKFPNGYTIQTIV